MSLCLKYGDADTNLFLESIRSLSANQITYEETEGRLEAAISGIDRLHIADYDIGIDSAVTEAVLPAAAAAAMEPVETVAAPIPAAAANVMEPGEKAVVVAIPGSVAAAVTARRRCRRRGHNWTWVKNKAAKAKEAKKNTNVERPPPLHPGHRVICKLCRKNLSNNSIRNHILWTKLHANVWKQARDIVKQKDWETA